MVDSASLMELQAMLVDACKGYDEAIQAAEKPRLKALFEKAKSVHEKSAWGGSCDLEGKSRQSGLRSFVPHAGP